MRAAYGQYTGPDRDHVLPHRARLSRRCEGARRRVLRCPDGTRGREFSHQRSSRARRSRLARRPSSRKPPQRPTRRSAVSTPTSRAPSRPPRTKSSRENCCDQFVVDVYQAGAGTSHNMNANEVIANRASEILGEPRGTYTRVHPNDHVNMGQSTNDVFPTATRLALLLGLDPLVASARLLAGALRAKADAFASVLKTGRTHLQDAVPITLGQEFSGYAECVSRGADDVTAAAEQLRELNIGATAVGTGLNAGEDYRRLVVDIIAKETGIAVRPRREPVSRDAEHGGRARVLGRHATTGCGSRQGRQRSAAARHGAARRHRGDHRCRPSSPVHRSCPARSTRRWRR